MLAQILLNLSVLVFGLVLIFPFSSRINTSLYVALAWFCGWATIVILEILLIIAGVYVTIPKIAGYSAFCVIVLWFAARNSITERMVFGRRELQRSFWQFAILLLLCVLVIVLLGYFGTYTWYTPDSCQIEALGRTFHKYGVYGDGKLFYGGQTGVGFSILFRRLMPFCVAINNVAYLCGIEVFYSFMGATTFFICLALWGFWRGENYQFGFVSLIWLLLVLALFLSNRMVVVHSFKAITTNLTTMAYYTLGILSLYEYLNKKDYLWFMLACLFLGCTGILRIEMLAFSLIPFCIVGWKKCLPKLKITFFGFVLYFLVSYVWFCWGFLGLIGISEVIAFGGLMADGAISVVAFGFVLSPIIFFFPWRTTNKRVRVAIYIILFLSVLFFICYFNNELMITWNALYLLTAKGVGRWGSFWWLLFFGVCIYALLRILPVLFKILPGEIKVPLRADITGMDFLAFVIIAFFITRIVLYGITEGPMDKGWYHSGNRILLHIYPVGVYFLGRLGFICTREIT